MSQGQFEQVPLSVLRLDRVCQRVSDRASIVSGLRGKPLHYAAGDHGAAILDSIQMPIMAYRSKGSEHVTIVSGVFTYHRLLQQQATSRPVELIPVFMLKKPPRPDIRELLILHELTRSLLKHCFTHSSAKIADYLYAWFDCSNETSLFATDKWLQLFPQLTTKTDLCNWLELSSKTFIPTDGH
ncbi:TPA: hypothetical protein P2I01_004294 [Aeromonas salmonicida]|nr:hypothetical protein [Aeromonas salmonicida]